jgi:hypothetical protein
LAGQVALKSQTAFLTNATRASLYRRASRAHAKVGSWLEEPAVGRRVEFTELMAHSYAAAAADLLPEVRQPHLERFVWAVEVLRES